MRILAIGDVTDSRAAAHLAARLWEIRRALSLDFVAVNAENAGFIVGPDPEVATALLDGGADVLTGGNHTLQKKSLFPLLENDKRVLRPANYPPEAPGAGYAILDAKGYRLLVMNAVGRVEMERRIVEAVDFLDGEAPVRQFLFLPLGGALGAWLDVDGQHRPIAVDLEGGRFVK